MEEKLQPADIDLKAAYIHPKVPLDRLTKYNQTISMKGNA